MGRGSGNKRKKSKSPKPKGKKQKANSIPSLPSSRDSSLSSMRTVSHSNLPTTLSVPSPAPIQQSKSVSINKLVKPIFVNTNVQVIKNLLINISFSTKPTLQIRRDSSVQISCASTEDKDLLLNKLKSQQIGYYTFTDSLKKPVYYLMKGFYAADCAEVLKLIQESSVPAIKVTDFIRKTDYVIYIVHFNEPFNVNQLNHSHRSIDGFLVKWEIMRKSNKKVTQCYNCQRWGHSSINCNLPSRCVKCTESHAKGACERKSPDQEGSPKCVNCDGNHSANAKECPAFIQHINKLKSHPKKPVRRMAPVPAYLDPAHFPSIPVTSNAMPGSSQSVGVSFSHKLKESNHNQSLLDRFKQAQSKFCSLPNISSTVETFIQMVDEISLCEDDSTRLIIIMKYCTPNLVPNNGC